MLPDYDVRGDASNLILQNLSAPLRRGRPKQIWASEVYGMAVEIAKMLCDPFRELESSRILLSAAKLITPLAFTAHVSPYTRRVNEWIKKVTLFNCFAGGRRKSTNKIFASWTSNSANSCARITPCHSKNYCARDTDALAAQKNAGTVWLQILAVSTMYLLGRSLQSILPYGVQGLRSNCIFFRPGKMGWQAVTPHTSTFPIA